MPFYEYECQSCKFYTEIMQKISDPPLEKCPSCGKNAMKKLISAPVFRLKGDGWYETDFKSEKEEKRNLAVEKDSEAADEKPAAEPAKAEEAKPDAKAPAAKQPAESKPAAAAKRAPVAKRKPAAASRRPAPRTKPKSKPKAKARRKARR